jgi:hypothetical protein
MSDAESDPHDEAPAFVESETRETSLPYGEGRLPFYVAVAWVAIIVTYVVVMALLALPDLRKWMAH